MPYKTTEPRDDHILWECKRLKDAASMTCCGKFNGMRDEKCGWCKTNRDIGSMAVDRTRKTIGKLVEKNPDGLDVWKYDDDVTSTKFPSRWAGDFGRFMVDLHIKFTMSLIRVSYVPVGGP
ncbi:hypothetical protein SNK03_000204 [Fusarium graminearum]